jgi:hypothetical protein
VGEEISLRGFDADPIIEQQKGRAHHLRTAFEFQMG